MSTVTFTSVSPVPGANSVSANLIGNPSQSRAGGTSASASAGTGGWQITDRTRQKATTEWLDYYPMVLTFTLLLDGGPGLDAGSVEDDITVFESFELPVPGSVPPLPPIIVIAGPVPHTELFWVCSRLSLDGGEDSCIRDPNTNLRTQQSITLELTEYSPAIAITSSLSPAQQAVLQSGSSAGSATFAASGATYTVAAGDTLQSIAAQKLGNVNLWVNLAVLNSLSNSAILTPGQVLQLPTT